MIKRTRIHYWSCSKFANYIRGTPKPLGLTFDEWDMWHEKAKKNHPVRYWIAEELFDKIQDLINFPIDIIYTIKIYVKNRFIDKTHYLKTGLKPGSYYDLDTRILYGLFNELIDLVEIEYAHLSIWDKKHKYKFNRGRCVDAGLDYLKWASGLKYSQKIGLRKGDKRIGEPTDQAKAAQKTLKLYNWWKNRSKREDPNQLFSKETHGKNYYSKIDKMQKDFYIEDNEMLIELIKLREHLWT